MTTFNRKKTAAALIVAVLALAAFFVFQRPSHKNPGANPTTAAPSGKAVQTSAATSPVSPALKSASSLPTESDATKRLDSALADLKSPTNADEWAVSLRNYAHAYPTDESIEFLRAKTEELIRNPKWRLDPSIGFFESFDVLVHTRATESSGLLSELVADRSPEGKPLAHASFLTLYRLTFREPAAMMEQLATHPELTQARGEMVANFFARADLANPVQQQLCRSYLLDPARNAAELNAFAGIFPNANFTISKNLLSENLTLSRDEITTRDAAALAIVNDWLADPAFESVKLHLTNIHQRLTTFVTQARR